MKKLAVLLLIAVALVLPLTAGGSKDSSSTSAKQTVLTLSEVHAEGYPTTLADYEFARLVEERTEGRIKIDVYSGGTLYGEETGSIEALQIGTFRSIDQAQLQPFSSAQSSHPSA